MTNEEKATELTSGMINKWGSLMAYHKLTQMAEWKDKQFKEYLKKKKADNPKTYRSDWKAYENAIIHDTIDEIINELFNNE